MSRRQGARADRQNRRREEIVTRALGRSDVRSAVDGLLDLAPGDREPLLPAVAAGFRQAALRAFEHSAWADLATAAARAEAEPRLLGTEADAKAVRWALFWGAARGRALPRAERFWAAIRETLATVNPEASKEISEWLAAGAPLPAAPRERPGGDRSRLPAPDSPESVAISVAEARQRLQWPDFSKTVWRWLGVCTPDTAVALRVAAGRMAARELALGSETPGDGHVPGRGQGLAAPGVAERFLARLIVEAPAAPALEAEVGLALRRVWGALGADGLGREDAVRFVAVGMAACRYPALRSLLAAALVNVPILPDACDQAVPLLETLLAAQCEAGEATPALWAKTLRTWDFGRRLAEEAEDFCSCPACQADEPLPASLLAGAERLLAGGGLPAWLEAAPEAHGFDVLAIAATRLDTAVCVRLFEEAWEGAGADMREDLAQMILIVLQRSQAFEHHRVVEAERDLALVRGSARRGVPARTVALLEDIERHPMRLQGRARRIWDQVGERVLPYDPEFLEIAFELAPGESSSLAAASRYLESGESLVRRLDVLETADIMGNRSLFSTLASDFLAEYGDRAGDLADALDFAAESDFPGEFLVELAIRLVAAARRGSVPDTEEFRATLAWARTLVPRRQSRAGDGHSRPKGQGKAPAGARAGAEPQVGARAKAEGQRKASAQKESGSASRSRRTAVPEPALRGSEARPEGKYQLSLDGIDLDD